MSAPLRGWILFDQSCGFCARWVPFWGPWLLRQGFAFRPLQDPWIAEQTGLHPDDLLKDIRLLRSDGFLISGAEVYRHVLASNRWTRPIAAFTRLPGIRRMFEGAYRLFARHRYRVSAACGWKAPGEDPR